MKIMKSLLCSSPSSLKRWISRLLAKDWRESESASDFLHASKSLSIALGGSSVLQRLSKRQVIFNHNESMKMFHLFFNPPQHEFLLLHPCKCPSLQRCRHTQCDSFRERFHCSCPQIHSGCARVEAGSNRLQCGWHSCCQTQTLSRKIRKAIIVHRIQRCMSWYLCSSIKYHQSTPQFRMFFVNDGYPYCRNSARSVSPHLFATFLSLRIPNCSFQYYLEGSSHKNQASIIPPTLQSSKYSPTCATETKREKSTKTFTSAINAA